MQRDHFNNISQRYLKNRSNKNHLAYKEVIWSYILPVFKSFIKSKSQLNGLEAMCGNAEASIRILDRINSIKMSAFDYSDNMVCVAKKNKKGINIFQMDILKFNCKEKYDFVILIGGLHHVYKNADHALSNIFNCLKNNGVFLNLEPTHNNYLWRKIRELIYKHNDLFEESNERGFKLEEYNDLMNRKFKIKFQFYPGLLGYVLYYNPDAFTVLNKGGTVIAKLLAKLDLFLGATFIGKNFSFATWTIAIKK